MPQLEQKDFDTFVRLVRNVSIENVTFLRDASFRNLRRLKGKRDLEYAVDRTPAGSNQVDTGALVGWMLSIQRNEPEAIKQLLILDATLVKRC